MNKTTYCLLLVTCLLASCSVKPKTSTSKTDLPKMNVFLAPNSNSGTNPLSTIMLIEAGEEKLLGNFDKAIQFYHQALVADSTNDAAYYELSDIYLTDEKLNVDEALRNIKKANKIDPSNETYQVILGRLFVDTEHYDEGIKQFETLVEKHPKKRDYVFDLAYAYEQAGRVDDAIKLYNELEKKYGFDPEINYQKHVLYFQEGRIDEGVAEIEKIVKEYPDNTRYTTFLAGHYYKKEDFQQAANYARQAVNNNSPDAKSYVYLLESELQLGNKSELIDILNRVANSELELDQKIQVFYPVIGMVTQYPEMKDDLIQATKQLTLIYPNEAKTHALYGDVLSHAGYQDLANQEYLNSTNFDSTNYSVWEQLLFYYLDQKDYKKLATTGQKAAELFPNRVFPAYIGGYAMFRNKNYQGAIKLLEQAKHAEDINDELKIQTASILGDSYYQIGEYQKSFINYDQVLLAQPDNDYVLNNYSYHLAKQGLKLDKAEEMAKRAAQLKPTDANTLDTYGYVLYKNGKYQEAVAILELATKEMENQSADVFEHYGDALFKTGKENEALKQWQKALELDPENETLQRKVSSKTLSQN